MVGGSNGQNLETLSTRRIRITKPLYVNTTIWTDQILPRDILRGHIDHALAISVPGPASRLYVQPASSTDGNGAVTSLPEGARIRLKPGFDIARALRLLPGGTNLTAARVIMQALKTYGASVVATTPRHATTSRDGQLRPM